MRIPWRDRIRPAGRRPMTCEEVGAWLQHHLDHELDERRTARLAAHLEDCKRCGLEVDTYERIKHSLARARPSVPDDAMIRLREFGQRIARGEEPAEP